MEESVPHMEVFRALRGQRLFGASGHLVFFERAVLFEASN